MSLYNDASLLLIPSGYKSGKLYTQKPTDGSGDLTFTRASDATRVNSEGFIEKVRTNVLLQSNQFDTTWTTGGLTETSGQSGYDGSSDAWLIENVAAGSRFLTQTGLGLGVATFSIYAKAGTTDWISLNNGVGVFAYYDLTNGVLGSVAATAIDAKIESVGGGWYRCSIMVSAANEVRYYLAVGNNSLSTSVGDNIYIQDAQLEQGLVATDVIETTSAAVSVGMTADVPRLDYTNSSCPSLLLEPQRTNLVTQSEYFGDYGQINTSVTTDRTTSPEGLENATKVIATGTGPHYIQSDPITYTSSTTYTYSVFAKKSNTSLIQLLAPSTSFGLNAFASYNFDTLEVTEGSSATASMEDYGNGWYRLIMTATALYSSTISSFFVSFTNDKSVRIPGFDSSGEEFFIYGAMLEASASYASSYIPTLGTSVTRVADECYKTGISSLIGQTEGTIFMDFVLDSIDGSNDFRFDITDGALYDNEIFIGMTNGDLRALIRVSASTIYDSGNISATVGTRYKMALAYANNDVAFYVNGTQENASSSATIPSTDEITIGNRTHNKEMVLKESLNQAILFKTRLSNTDCEVITSEGYDSYSAMATALNYTVL